MSRRSPALLLVHAVWATSRRRHLLHAAFDEALAGILGARVRDAECILLAAGCADDHVHVIVRLDASARLADLMQQMKGGGAYDANRHPFVPQRIEWQDGYWAESLGPGDFDPLARYVRDQRLRHDPSHPAERWQFSDDEEWEPAVFGGL